MVMVRLATEKDIAGIMQVEEETFGRIGEDAMAAQEMLMERIKLCNGNGGRWFWVAEHKGHLVGDMILQPMQLNPDGAVSWESSTDGGTLKRTFNKEGNAVFVVSLAVCARAPAGTNELLGLATLAQWAASGKEYYAFCMRMPGFAAAHKRTGVSAEMYWQMKRADGGPKDPLLRKFWMMSGGVQPYKLLKNGYPPDEESGGHAVFFALEDPVKALIATAQLIYQSNR
jgi:hypothetical protein